MPEISKIAIDVNSYGQGTFFLDGIDISKYIRSISIDMTANDVPLVNVTLAFAAVQASVEGELVVRLRGDDEVKK